MCKVLATIVRDASFKTLIGPSTFVIPALKKIYVVQKNVHIAQYTPSLEGLG